VTFARSHLNLLIARNPASEWANALPERLSPWPLALHWSENDEQVVGLTARDSIHVMVLDDALPVAGGLDTLRRLRRMGMMVPCLYVCEESQPRLLTDAMKLDVFSVIETDQGQDLLPEMIAQIAQRVYQMELPDAGNRN